MTEQKTPPNKERLAEQRRVDALLLPIIKGVELLPKYLTADLQIAVHEIVLRRLTVRAALMCRRLI